MKKRILALLLALVMALLLAACSKSDGQPNAPADNPASPAAPADKDDKPASEPSGEKTKLTFMGWGTDAEIATFTTMIEQFENEYQDVEVEYIVVPDNDFDTRLQTMIGAGQCPDVFYINIDWLMKYASTGSLYDLTAYAESNDIFDPDNVWNCLNKVYRYDGEYQGQGNIYAFPKDVSAFPIFYNVDLFKQASVTPPTADDPWDWNDFIEAAKKLTSGEGDSKIYGTGGYSREAAVWSNGTEWVDQETLTQVKITDPAFIEAMQFCADLTLVHGVAPTPEESTALGDYDRFKQGKLAMVGAGTWSLADLWANCDFEWDVMPWPVSPNTGKTEIWFGTAGLAVSAATKNPEAACNLAAYLAYNEDTQRTAYQMGQAIPTLKDMAYGEFVDAGKAPANKQVLFDMMENTARLATQSRTFNQEWFAEFNSNAAAVYEGTMTAEEYCNSVAGTCQQLLDESIALKAEYTID
jgi:multiple sugar transport system substrate-binding protein